MKTTCCVWCWKLVKVADDFDEKKHKAVCSPGCKAGESVFNVWMSDEEINRRAHYRHLTRGDDDG